MNYHTYLKPQGRLVESCVIGTGGFGRSFLAQGHKVPGLSVRVGVDVTPEIAAEAMRVVGIPEAQIRICYSTEQAQQAWDSGAFIAAGDFAHVASLPLNMVLEATGHPEHGARHARLAIEAGLHLGLVSKEVDSVIGSGLAAMAAENGQIVTPIDGDQPSLLIGLITWAQVLGLEIVAAGKSSEYDFVFDPETGIVTANGTAVHMPEFGTLLHIGDRSVSEIVKARAHTLSMLPQRAVPDLCEMTVVANACAMLPDRWDMHAPIARIDEVPSILCSKDDGGLLNETGTLDVFHCLRRPDEVSFAGGVFVVFRVETSGMLDLLREKGHVVGHRGTTAMAYLPRHMLGFEAATSVLEVGLNKVSSGAVTPTPHADLIAFADIDLSAGTLLEMGGHHHSINGVSARIVAGSALGPDSASPFYIAANARLKRAVPAGQPICIRDLDLPEDSDLLRIRRWQDKHFFRQARPGRPCSKLKGGRPNDA